MKDWHWTAVYVVGIVSFLVFAVVMGITSNNNADAEWSSQCSAIGGTPSKIDGTHLCVLPNGTFIND